MYRWLCTNLAFTFRELGYCPMISHYNKKAKAATYQYSSEFIDKIVEGQWPSFWETQWDSQHMYVASP